MEVKYLIEKGAEVETRNGAGWTPLHWASEKGNLEVVKYLIEKGAEVEARDQWEKTPLHKATINGHLEVVKYLFLERNALMPIRGMFKYPELIKKKMGRETESQSILDYFLQNKSKYKPEEIQEFKMRFLQFQMSEEDTQNLKSIVKFL